MAGYKSGHKSKVIQDPQASVHNSELNAIFTIILAVPEFLNVVTESQHVERVVLPKKNAKFIPDNSKLTLLFIIKLHYLKGP